MIRKMIVALIVLVVAVQPIRVKANDELSTPIIIGERIPVLNELSVNVGQLNPTFDSFVLEYTVEVLNDVSEIEFKGLADEGVEIFGLGTHPLAEGTNTMTLFAQRGEDSTAYTIYVYREKGEIPSEPKPLPDDKTEVEGAVSDEVLKGEEQTTPSKPVTGMTSEGHYVVLAILLVLVGIGSFYKSKRYY